MLIRRVTEVSRLVLAASMLSACAAKQANPEPAAATEAKPRPGSLAYDKALWIELLEAHTKIRRSLVFTETTIETNTESDDPAIVAKLIDHALAMKVRMAEGAQVRTWDPVFKQIFSKHAAAEIAVTPTANGVKIVETSGDQDMLRFMRAHALGVNDFVRGGLEASQEATPTLEPADPIPMSEVAIGGEPHRILLGQPSAAQLALLNRRGVRGVVNFRKTEETPGFVEADAAAAASLSYCSIAYRGAAELTDDVIEQTREQLRAATAKNEPIALHCRSGSRVGPGWAAYRVLDRGIALDQAMAEARLMNMTDPAVETRTRAFIVSRQGVQPLSAAQ